uniref:Very-long-chain (3R)-3-hydroxyacyl-CoA dehydratase n=1 Tax=Oryza punctata TaxID=4537 RepID=A0A0E0JE32_ORYPU
MAICGPHHEPLPAPPHSLSCIPIKTRLQRRPIAVYTGAASPSAAADASSSTAVASSNSSVGWTPVWPVKQIRGWRCRQLRSREDDDIAAFPAWICARLVHRHRWKRCCLPPWKHPPLPYPRRGPSSSLSEGRTMMRKGRPHRPRSARWCTPSPPPSSLTAAPLLPLHRPRESIGHAGLGEVDSMDSGTVTATVVAGRRRRQRRGDAGQQEALLVCAIANHDRRRLHRHQRHPPSPDSAGRATSAASTRCPSLRGFDRRRRLGGREASTFAPRVVVEVVVA